MKKLNSGLCIGNVKLESFAYTDDVSLFSSTVTGLQNLVDACYYYSKKWRFNFGIKKSKCMTVGVNKFKNEPRWRLGFQTMENEITLEMLGVLFSSDGHSNPHVNNRIMKCRRLFYSLSGCGMSFPGFNVDIKKYIWDSVCVSTLKYGLETMYLSNTQNKRLESLQGTLLKSSLCLSIHSHHSKLIRALNVAPVGEIIKEAVCGL